MGKTDKLRGTKNIVTSFVHEHKQMAQITKTNMEDEDLSSTILGGHDFF